MLVYINERARVFMSSEDPPVDHRFVSQLFAKLERLATAVQNEGTKDEGTKDEGPQVAEVASSRNLLATLSLPEHLQWVRCESLQGNLDTLSRPALLAALKDAGISSLPDRQTVANALSRARRQRAELQQALRPEQTVATTTTAACAGRSATRPGAARLTLHTQTLPPASGGGPQRVRVAVAVASVPEQPTFVIVGARMEVLRAALLRRGWREEFDASSRAFALKWARKASECGVEPPTACQVLNHFRGAHELVTKHGLCRNLRALHRLDGVDIRHVAPPTFYAGDATQLRELIASHEAASSGEGAHVARTTWIVKSEGGRRGEGIRQAQA